ncbi:MAG TPA: helix-turn-helix domain-containing protein [Planctomycetota bacterium]|nr:helix-turn-helix domain-containing protein [Planctomycetota bacterium]
MKLLGSEEAQEKLGISRPTLYLWVRQGKLKPQRAGRALRFEETEIERLLGQGPHVAVWIRGGRLEEARREVARWTRTKVRPLFLLEYLAPPTAVFARGRVLSSGDGSELQPPSPGGRLFDALLESMKRREHVFLSHEESVWVLQDVRGETSPGGDPYIAVDVSKREGPGEGDERDRRLRDFVGTMRAGLTGRVKPWTRNELHERGPD